MFSCISSQSWVRGQKYPSGCLQPVTQPFKHFVLRPQTQKVFKKHGCAGVKLILQGVLRESATELCEPLSQTFGFY